MTSIDDVLALAGGFSHALLICLRILVPSGMLTVLAIVLR